MDNILNVDFALSSNNIDPLRGLCEQFKNELVTTILDQELLLAIRYSSQFSNSMGFKNNSYALVLFIVL